ARHSLHSIGAILDNPDHLDVAGLAQDHAQSFRHNGLIVAEQDADHGTTSLIVVPPAAPLAMSSVPPCISARSRMSWSPMWSPRSVAASNPRPLSRTVSVTSPLIASVTASSVAPAWRAVLASASCAMR